MKFALVQGPAALHAAPAAAQLPVPPHGWIGAGMPFLDDGPCTSWL